MSAETKTHARLRRIAESARQAVDPPSPSSLIPHPSRSVRKTRRVGWRGSQSVRNDEGLNTICGRCPEPKFRHVLGNETCDGYCTAFGCECPGYLEPVLVR